MSGSTATAHDVFVYGSSIDPDVIRILLDRVPEAISSVLPGFHRFRIKGRLHPGLAPVDTGKVVGKVLKGLTDDEVKILDLLKGPDYERKMVEVELTDTSEKLQAESYVWAKKDDPDLYGEWDFEEWKLLHKDQFVMAVKSFNVWKKDPEEKTEVGFI
ncbi:PREDICTED: protein AIG2 A-like [Tarenaya hassleriana]|uniref:protein AIG2 A-like n=1 Tax=Tarenaya hassleriana TaxID=28532 RepID=UPI00053C44C4|nr:PREDICTED: protein AIG2 A-like [Tarenaya hassleriana]